MRHLTLNRICGTLAAVLVVALLPACGESVGSSDEPVPTRVWSTSYEEEATKLELHEPSNRPTSGDWADVAQTASTADFDITDDVEYLIGMSELIVVGSVIDVAGPYRVVFGGTGAPGGRADDGVFWIEARVDRIVAGEGVAVGETFTHAVSVVLDPASGEVFQFAEDPIPGLRTNLVFFIAGFEEFDDLPYASITGVGSGRIPEAELQQTLGVRDAAALRERADGRLGLIAAANRAENLAQERGEGAPTGTTLPAND